MPKNISSEATLVIVKPRLRNSCSGSIGSACARLPGDERRHEQRRRSPSAAARSRLVQPWSLPRTTPKTMPSRPRLARARPGRSSGSRARGSRRAGHGRSAAGRRRSVRSARRSTARTRPRRRRRRPAGRGRPPGRRPRPSSPSARPRRCGGDRRGQQGEGQRDRIAAPTPCTARAATSDPMLGASAAAADPAVNRPRPPVKAGGGRTARPAWRREQQHGECQGVRVDSPLQPLQRGVQVVADRRQRRRHHEVVQ